MDRLRIELGTIFRIKDLGTEFELPDTQELRDALDVLQGVCATEVFRRKKSARHEFLVKKWSELRCLERSSHGGSNIIAVLEEIVDYGRKE